MFMLNFLNVRVSSEEWCYANNVSYGNIVTNCCQLREHRLKSGERYEGVGGALPYLAYTGMCC